MIHVSRSSSWSVRCQVTLLSGPQPQPSSHLTSHTPSLFILSMWALSTPCQTFHSEHSKWLYWICPKLCAMPLIDFPSFLSLHFSHRQLSGFRVVSSFFFYRAINCLNNQYNCAHLGNKKCLSVTCSNIFEHLKNGCV